MAINNKISHLQLALCELKLEQRHLNTDMANLLKNNKTVDFLKIRELKNMKNSVAKKISSVEKRIDPNIIA
ncbi:MAG: hypothetical protein IJ099_05650 [Alphaproteobacteria bacterium]|nr:hypothetical protein [Alphaproteobacteria bacterium]